MSERMPLPANRAPLGGCTGSEFEPLLDSEEAAVLLKLHPKTLQKMARRTIHSKEC